MESDGVIGHAEFRIGDSVVMAFDARPGWPDTPAFLRLYVADGDAVFRQALAAGDGGDGDDGDALGRPGGAGARPPGQPVVDPVPPGRPGAGGDGAPRQLPQSWR